MLYLHSIWLRNTPSSRLVVSFSLYKCNIPLVTSTNGFPETKLIIDSFWSSFEEAIDWPLETSLPLFDIFEIPLASLFELLLLGANEIGVDSLVDILEDELFALLRSMRDDELTPAPYSLKSPVRLLTNDGEVSYSTKVYIDNMHNRENS